MNNEEAQFDKKWDKRYMEHVASSHSTPSPETKVKLAILETNNKNIMDILKQSIQDNKEAHESLVESIKSIETKLDNALISKADKKEVDEMKESIKDLDTWKIKIIAYGSALLFLVTFFKDIIINKLTGQ